MLYPKIYIEEKERKTIIEEFKYIKESICLILNVFSNYSSMLLFIKQKFHF